MEKEKEKKTWEWPAKDRGLYCFHETMENLEWMTAITTELDAVGIPSVLWEEFALWVWGVPTVVWDLHLVVPDDALDTAVSTLADKKLGTKCTKGADCKYVKFDQDRHMPQGHLHTLKEESICLYKKSEVYPQLNSLEVDGSGDVIYVSDPSIPEYRTSRGGGRWEEAPGMTLPRVPSATRMMETAMLLRLRDGDKFLLLRWKSVVHYLLLYVDENGQIDHEKLPPHHAEFLKSFRKGAKDNRMIAFQKCWKVHAELNPGIPTEAPDLNVVLAPPWLTALRKQQAGEQ